jgi:hypothetical protein
MLTNERPSSSLPLAPFCVNYSCIFWDLNYFCVSDHTKAEETGDCCQNGPKLVALGFSFSDVGFSYPNVSFRAETREERVLHINTTRAGYCNSNFIVSFPIFKILKNLK